MSALRFVVVLSLTLLASACSDDAVFVGGGGTRLNEIGYQIKQLRFSWPSVPDAETYRILENPDGVSGYMPITGNLPVTTLSFNRDIAVHLQDWNNARYLLQSCIGSDCTNSTARIATESTAAIGYFKASNTGMDDNFGQAVAVSDDGRIVAVGAWAEDSDPAVGDDNDNLPQSGAVYLFTRVAEVWEGPVMLKASNADSGDQFGYAVALSVDGSTLAVGARSEASADATDPDNNLFPGAGAVYLFVRDGNGDWIEEAYIKASNVEAGDNFGHAVALSDSGNTLVVGAPGEDGAAGLIPNSGAVYTFNRGVGGWAEQDYLKASNASAGDGFGNVVSLNGTGNVLAVGAPFADVNSGAVYLFSVTTGWNETALLRAANAGVNDNFGASLALSGDGLNLVVGAPFEDSDGLGDNDNEFDSGAAYVFINSGGWLEQTMLKAGVASAHDQFGVSVAIGGGDNVAVGADREDGAAIGVGGDPQVNTEIDAGAGYIFTRDAGAWSQHAYLKASNTEFSDNFGTAMAMSADGQTLAVGATGEDGAGTGIGGEQLDNTTLGSGAVYLY